MRLGRRVVKTAVTEFSNCTGLVFTTLVGVLAILVSKQKSHVVVFGLYHASTRLSPQSGSPWSVCVVPVGTSDRFRQSEIQRLDLADLNVVSNRRRRNPLLVQPYVESLLSTIYQVVGDIAQVWPRRESISRSPDRLQ